MKRNLSISILTILLISIWMLAGCRQSHRDQLLTKKDIVFICQHHKFGVGIPDDLAENAALVDVVAPMWFDIRDDGEVVPIHPGGDLRPYVEFCKENGIALLPIVRNFKPRVLLLNPEAVARAIREIDVLVEREGFDGFTLDIEEDGTDGVTRVAMLELMREAYAKMKERGKLFCATFSPIQWNKGGNWQGDAMLEHCDWVFGMFYDYSGPWNMTKREPTSTAPYDWPSCGWDIRRDVEKVLQSNVNGKVIFGIPSYGNIATFDAKGACTSLVAQSVARLIEMKEKAGAPRLWDSVARTPYFEIQSGTETRRGWYEDAESYDWRLQLVKDKGCAGVGVWSVGAPGGADPDFWPSIRKFRRSE